MLALHGVTVFFFASRRRHTGLVSDWSSDVCSSDLCSKSSHQSHAECASPHPAWLWCDDFEQDRLSRYFEYDNAGGKFARVAEIGRASCRERATRFWPVRLRED